MSPKQQVQLSSVCLIMMILIMFAYGLLIFYVPMVMASYTESGEPLSPFLRFVLTIGDIVKNVELLFVPAMLLAFVASIFWRIKSSRDLHNSSN